MRIGRTRLDDGEVGRRPLVKLDEFVDVRTSKARGTIGPAHEIFESRPTGLMCRNERIDVHFRAD